MRFGALFSRQRSFFFLYYCAMCLRFRGFPVMLDIELSVSAWSQITRRVLLRARRSLILLLLAAERGCLCCAAYLSNQQEKKKKNGCMPPRTRKTTAASKTHPHRKTNVYLWNLLHGPASCTHTNADMSDMPSQPPTEHPRTCSPRSKVSEHMPRRSSCVCLPESSVSGAMVTGALEALKVVEVIRLAA